MRNIYNNIIHYKGVHPIRFWIILISAFVLFTLLFYFFKKVINGKKNGTKSQLKVENGHTEIDSDIKKQNTISHLLRNNKVLIGIVIGQIVLIGIILAVSIHYNSRSYISENPSISSSEYIFGIDISHYQERIDWDEMRTSHHPIEFVFIRSTMGVNAKDKLLKENWKKAKEHGYIRGAYHYYRPNENSTEQFENYKSQVKIEVGDFIPILDIEKESRHGRESLRNGVLNWLKLAEEEYGVKPMIYTGLKFYQDILKGHVDEYPLWLAAYSGKHRVTNEQWTFHQFTENVRVKGIKTSVDGNDFIGDMDDLKRMCKN